MEYLVVFGAILIYWIFNRIYLKNIEKRLSFVTTQWMKEIVHLDPAIRLQRIAFLSELSTYPSFFGENNKAFAPSKADFNQISDNAKCIKEVVDGAIKEITHENFGENYPPNLKINFGKPAQKKWLNERLKQVKDECVNYKK